MYSTPIGRGFELGIGEDVAEYLTNVPLTEKETTGFPGLLKVAEILKSQFEEYKGKFLVIHYHGI